MNLPLYIKIAREGEVSLTQELDGVEGVFIDRDKNGKVLGIEVIKYEEVTRDGSRLDRPSKEV